MFQGHLQCYIGACTRLRRCACAPEHIQYYCTVYEVQEEGSRTSTVFRGVGVAPPRLIYKKKTYTCTWTPNSHKARQEDNGICASLGRSKNTTSPFIYRVVYTIYTVYTVHTVYTVYTVNENKNAWFDWPPPVGNKKPFDLKVLKQWAASARFKSVRFNETIKLNPSSLGKIGCKSFCNIPNCHTVPFFICLFMCGSGSGSI